MCALHGEVSGSGLQLALGADNRLVDAQTTTFVHCGLVDATLPWLLGERGAEAFVAAGTLASEHAQRLGLAHETVSSADVVQSALQFAAWLAAQPPVGLKGTLRLMRVPLDAKLPASCWTSPRVRLRVQSPARL